MAIRQSEPIRCKVEVNGKTIEQRNDTDLSFSWNLTDGTDIEVCGKGNSWNLEKR